MPAAPAAPAIRPAVAADIAQLRALAREAYGKCVPRLNHEPAPMHADLAAHVAAAQAVVIVVVGTIAGYMIAWPEPDA
jgi:hypothetical protein